MGTIFILVQYNYIFFKQYNINLKIYNYVYVLVATAEEVKFVIEEIAKLKVDFNALSENLTLWHNMSKLVKNWNKFRLSLRLHIGVSILDKTSNLSAKTYRKMLNK